MRGSPERGSGGDSEGDIRGNVGRDFPGDLEGYSGCYSECYREGRSERSLHRHPRHCPQGHSDCNLQENLQGTVDDYSGGDLPGGLGACVRDCVLSLLLCSGERCPASGFGPTRA